MNRPLVITDCDEVLMHMVVPFAEWVDAEHGVIFRIEDASFANALKRKECGTPLEAAEVWPLLDGFFTTEMTRQYPIPGALASLAEIANHADIVVLTNVGPEHQQARIEQLALQAGSKLSREDVRAELREAQLNGDVIADIAHGLMRQRTPSAHLHRRAVLGMDHPAADQPADLVRLDIGAGEDTDDAPLDARCSCPVCSTYSRAYLHHLFKANEMLGPMLLTWHNIQYYQDLMAELRAGILAGDLAGTAARIEAGWQAEKEKLASASKLKEELESARRELELAQRKGDFARAGELTYGLERLAMYVQGVDNVYDLNFNGREGEEKISYGDVFLQAEQEYSRHNFEFANTEMLHRHFIDAEKECQALLAAGAPSDSENQRLHKCVFPAYDQCIKASHIFNLLDARGVISVTERQAYIGRVRALAKSCGEAFLLTDAGGANFGRAA